MGALALKSSTYTLKGGAHTLKLSTYTVKGGAHALKLSTYTIKGCAHALKYQLIVGGPPLKIINLYFNWKF